jgi:hypothetical protein
MCGYVAGRFRQKYPKLGTQVMQQSAASMGNYSWISLLSKGNLLHSCEELVSAAKIMEKEFFKMHGSGLCKKPLVFRSVVNLPVNYIFG